MKPGDTVLLPQPGNSIPHLWILLTAPCADEENGIFVNFTDAANVEGVTIVFGPGDHPYVTKTTAINYPRAKLLKVRLLETAISSGQFKAGEPLSREHLQRVCAGLLSSPFVSEKMKDFYIAHAPCFE